MEATEGPTNSPGWLLPSVDALLIIFAAVLLGFHIAWLHEPWDNSHCGVNSGAYYGYACKGLDAFGYGASRMQGPILFHPDGHGLFLPYTNHPGTIYAVFYPCYKFLGKDEASLRIPMLVILLVNILILRFGLGRIVGPITASLAAIGFTTLPLVLQFGKMVDLPLFCLAFFIPVTLTWLRFRKEQSRKSYWCFAFLAFLAGLFDWSCYFLYAGIVLDVLFAPGSLKAKFRLWLRGGLPFLAAFIMVFSWLSWAEGNWDRISKTVEGLLRAVGIRDPNVETELFIAKVSWGEWWDALTTNGSYTFTLPFILIGIFGLLATILIRRDRCLVLRPGLMLLISGLLPCVVFRTHASKHEFWPMVGLAGMALFFGQGIRAMGALASRLHLNGDVLAVTVVCVVGVVGTIHGHQYRDLRRGHRDLRQLATDMNESFRSTDIVFTSDSLSPSRFYRNFVTVPQVTNPTFMKHAIENIRPYRSQFARAYILWNKSTSADWTWLKAIPAQGPLKEVTYGQEQYFQRECAIDKIWDF